MKIFILLPILFTFSSAIAQYGKTSNLPKQHQMENLTSAKVVEYVTFKTQIGVSQQELLDAAFNTDEVLLSIPGFIHRSIAQQENGTWVEVVFWKNPEVAKIGLEVFLSHPKSKAFLDLIEAGTVKIEYSNIF